MNEKRLNQAIRNNAVWCDAVCRAHGCPGEFLEYIWICSQEAPPFYPNAIALSRGPEAEQRARILDLNESGLKGEWRVKDSFALLDLSGSGFQILFEALWIYLPASNPVSGRDLQGVRWGRVTTEPDLTKWEVAWRSSAGDENSADNVSCWMHRRVDALISGQAVSGL